MEAVTLTVGRVQSAWRALGPGSKKLLTYVTDASFDGTNPLGMTAIVRDLIHGAAALSSSSRIGLSQNGNGGERHESDAISRQYSN